MKKNQHPKISVITPTIRPKGIVVIQRSLSRQIFQDFEWLVEVGIPERGNNLCASLNKMLRRAKGDTIVMVQDYIKIPNDALEKIQKLHEENPKTFFTYSVAKTLDWKEVIPDWRHHGEKREIHPHEWESDFASAPLQAFKDVGGYDEQFDKGWSWENVNLAQRAHMAGYKFEVIPDIRSVALDHDKFETHPFRGKNENAELANGLYHSKIKFGNFKLNYLQ